MTIHGKSAMAGGQDVKITDVRLIEPLDGYVVATTKAGDRHLLEV